MASFNKVILVGNLTRDVELRYTQSGTAVTDMGLAVNDRRKNPQGEWVDEVTFVDITVWGRTAENVSQYLSKGSPVLVDGRLRLDQWDDKDTGQKRQKLAITANNVQFLSSGSGGGGGQRSSAGGSADAYSAPAETASQPSSAPPDSDLPF